VNLQFSCSFFLQGEGTPNGRLRERAGRLDVLDVAWGSAGLAMIGDCDHRWSLLGDCYPEGGSWERQLQAGGGGSRSFGGVAEILSSLGLLGLRGSERRRGAMRQRNRRPCRGRRLSQRYRSSVLKFDFSLGSCCDRMSIGLARGQCDAIPRELDHFLVLILGVGKAFARSITPLEPPSLPLRHVLKVGMF
jgi:hypothetical protein